MESARHVAAIPPDELRAAVANHYSGVATTPDGNFNFPVGRAFAEAVGYPAAVLDSLPPGASASFAGVAYPVRWARLRPGERVIDLGAGAGLDTLLAARSVGPTGHVHAIDLSPAMAALTRTNAAAAGLDAVTVHVAPVEDVPLPDASADCVIANGIINLSPEKARVVAEVARLLRPGGRFVAAEIVLTRAVPADERATLDDWFR